jgi:hypothetical protein
MLPFSAAVSTNLAEVILFIEDANGHTAHCFIENKCE